MCVHDNVLGRCVDFSRMGECTYTELQVQHVQLPCFSSSPHLLNLLQRQRAGNILLVGKDQQRGAEESLLLQQICQLLAAVLQPRQVGRVLLCFVCFVCV